MLFRFEASALILSPYAYLIIAVLSSFEIQNVFVLENWNLWLYHDNRNANVFLSPGKYVTLFYTLILPFLWISHRILQKTWAEVTFAIVSKHLFQCLFKDFSKGLGTLAVRAPTEHQTRLAWRTEVSFLKKKARFYHSTLLRQYLINLWKNRSKCRKRRMSFAGCLEKSFPKS